MSQEDEITNYLIEETQNLHNVDYDLEVPYNNYGDKGSVDLVIRCGFHDHKDIYSHEFIQAGGLFGKSFGGGGYHDMPAHQTFLLVVEVKSEYAVGEVTGANAIIRQFKRHQEHFFEGSSYERDAWDTVRYMLMFENTPGVLKHINKNYHMYQRAPGSVCVETRDHESVVWKSLPHRGSKPDWLDSQLKT